MAEQKTCLERVESHLESTIDDLSKLWKAYGEGEEEVEDLGHIYDYGLSFDYVAPDTFDDQEQGYFRYQLSWGGPSDEFRFFVNPDFSVYHIEYWFLDWGDGAHKNLRGEDHDLMEEIYEWFRECGTVQVEFDKSMEDA